MVLWLKRLGLGSFAPPLWCRVYTLLTYGLLADIHWSLVHWAFPSNTFVCQVENERAGVVEETGSRLLIHICF